MLKKRLLALLPLALLCQAGAAWAQWPERPITWVVPFAAGGPMDIVSRPVAKKMGDILGQAIIVENRSGAGGALGMDYIARAKPDGYVIGIGSVGTQTIVPNVTRAAKYDPIASFSNIGLLGRYTNVLLVSSRLPSPPWPTCWRRRGVRAPTSPMGRRDTARPTICRVSCCAR